MGNNKQQLPGIRRVGYIAAEEAPRSAGLKALSGIPVGIYTDIKWLETHGEGELKLKEEPGNNGTLSTATLKFRATGELPTRRRCAYIAEGVDGRSWMVGGRERPHARIEVEKTSGTSSGDPCEKSVTVTAHGVSPLSEVSF